MPRTDNGYRFSALMTLAVEAPQNNNSLSKLNETANNMKTCQMSEICSYLGLKTDGLSLVRIQGKTVLNKPILETRETSMQIGYARCKSGKKIRDTEINS